MRVRIRTMLWSTAFLAVVFATARHVVFTYLKIYGPQVSLLQVGDPVIIASDTGGPVRVVTADGTASLEPGTEASVTRESAWDQDSCYSDREIGLIVGRGSHQGLGATIRRDLLRLD